MLQADKYLAAAAEFDSAVKSGRVDLAKATSLMAAGMQMAGDVVDIRVAAFDPAVAASIIEQNDEVDFDDFNEDDAI